MPKKFIALLMAVVMTSQIITPVISYGEDSGTGTSAVNIEDSALSDSGIVIEEPTEITAEPTEIYSVTGSSSINEVISVDLYAEIPESGTCGENLTYTYADGVLTISGTGEMYSYGYYYSGNRSPFAYTGDSLTSVIIEEGVTTIGAYAFSEDGLESIDLPDSLITIEDEAFYYCNKLTDITIPDSVTTIGGKVFAYCSSLSNITIPGSVTSIGGGIFYECGFKTAGPIGGGYDIEFGWTETIPENAFSLSTNLTSVVIPDGVISIGYCAFEGCSSLTNINLPESLINIGNYVFCDCSSLVNITIPNAVTSIGYSAFEGCYSLTSVKLSESLTSIGNLAFYLCHNLISINLPESLISIGSQAFYECGFKTAGPIGGGYDLEFGWTESIPEYAFNRCNSLTSIILPDTVTSIGSRAFSNCSGLKSLVIPDGVTSINSYTFNRCISLTSVTIPDSVTSIGYYAFYDCSSLTNIIIPDSVTSIGAGAFQSCSSLTSITIPESVTSIGAGAFYDCSSLTSITIPNSVTSIGSSTFGNCVSVVLIVAPDSYAEEYAIENEISYIYYYYDTVNTITVNVTDENSEEISGEYSIYWYEEDSDTVISTGSVLSGAEEGAVYRCEIVLGSELASVYQNPDIIRVTAEEGDIEVNCILKKISYVNITGVIKDSSGNPVEGAVITITQTVNGTEVKTTAETDSSGTYTAQIVQSAAAVISVSKTGYYGTTASITAKTSDYTVSTISLTSLPDTKISLNILMQYSVKSGDTAYSTVLTSFKNLSFSLYNSTQGKEITDFVAQYPSISIADKTINEGDEIKITVSDTTGEMVSGSVSTVLDEELSSSASIQLTQNGKISITSITGSSPSTVFVFDNSGNLIESSKREDSFLSDALAEGDYTVVVMKYSTLLNNVSSLSVLNELGLNSGTDYNAKTVSVSRGVITAIDSVICPAFDESSLYYTDSSNTGFTAGSSSTTAGTLVTFRAAYAIDNQYSTSGQYITVDIPDGVIFTEGSVTLDSAVTTYSYSGNKLTVYTNKDSGIIRFYAAASEAGDYSLNGYLSFVLDGSSVMQPIGTASFTAESMTINLPNTTNKTTINVSGKTYPQRTVTVYVNGEAAGTTTSNKAGSWECTADLGEQYRFSYNLVYAEAYDESSDYLTIISETELVKYDIDSASVKSVTMITPDSSTIIYNFEDPAVTSYNRFTSGNFTFKIDIEGDVSYVVLYVYTSLGNTYSFDAEYSEESGVWVVSQYFSMSESPVSVGVAFNSDNEILISRDELNDAAEIPVISFDDVNEEMEPYYERLEEITAEYDMENLEGEELLTAFEAHNEALYQLIKDMEADGTDDTLIDDFDFELEGFEILDDETIINMTDEEFADYINGLLELHDNITVDYEANISAVEDPEELFGDTSCVEQDTSGLTAEGLLADGFEAYAVDDGSTVYYMYDDNSVQYVDFVNDKWYTIYFDSESTAGEIVEAAFALEQTVISVDLSDDETLLTLNKWLLDLGDKLNLFVSYINSLYEVNNGTANLIAENFMEANKATIISEYKYGNATTAVIRRGIDLRDSAAVMEAAGTGNVTVRNLNVLSQNQNDFMGMYFEAVKNKNKLNKLHDILENSKFLKVLGAVVNVATFMLELIEKSIQLYNVYIPEECKGDEAALASIKSEFNSLKTQSIIFITANCVLIIADIAELMSGIGAIGGIFVGFLQGVAVENYSRSFDNKLENIIQNRDLLNCTLDDDDDSGSGDGDGGTGSSSSPYSTSPGSTYYNGEDPTSGNIHKYPGNNSKVSLDPSGYVYEAVPSNRLEGVTTTIYYSEEETDDFGMLTGNTNTVLWDAEEYDQENPLITDSNGYYNWDVPIGSWQVKYEKEGYTTAYSEWLPVPPPQVDVNQALVSTSAPDVETVNVYGDEIQVIFSKYMKLSAGDSISVTINGEAVEGTVSASNAEYNSDETEQYASIFVFTPNENISGEATVTITEAESYNGLKSAEYSVTKTAVIRPQYINSAESIDVKYNSGALLEVEILPHEAAEELIVEAVLSSEDIATVTNSSAEFDESGIANIMLNGIVYGQTTLALSVPGTDLSKTVTVNVVSNVDTSSKCAKVTASVASGSTVESGTELVLSTETDGAEIYYTLDGTCPCTIGSESRLLYTEPLVLTEDTFIIAYAIKDGYDDSNTAGFIYTIADSGDDTTEESTEESTEASTETVSESTTETTTETKETSTETTTATADATIETTTKTASSSSSSGGGGGGSSSIYIIKLVPNNGVNASTTYVKKNGTLAEPNTPVYEGYTFTGWYTDSDCTTLYDFSAKVNSSFTLYGGWKEADEEESAEAEIEAEETQTETEEAIISRIVRVVIGSAVVTVETEDDENTYTMDTAPYIQPESSSTLVPLRFVAVAIYGTEIDNADSSDIVAWNSATKTASISVGNDTISFIAGSEYMNVNGEDVLMSNGVKAEITDSRMFIPFRALGEALGVEVDWDSTTKTAIYTAE